MAATRLKCSVCSDLTNYHCISCQVPICNICSIFEEDEESPDWKAGKSVAYCLKCKNYVGFCSEMQTTQPQNLTEARTANCNEDFVQKIEKLKDVLRSPSDRFAIHIIHVLYEMRYRLKLGHSI